MQREVRPAIQDMPETPLADPGLRAVDGCAIPTYAIPLKALARGFARFGAGDRLTPARAAAAGGSHLEAVAAHPEMVAGTGRFDTVAMRALGLRAFVKTGAEGVYCAALPELGLGVAIKCEDGARRAAETAMAALVARIPAAWRRGTGRARRHTASSRFIIGTARQIGPDPPGRGADGTAAQS